MQALKRITTKNFDAINTAAVAQICPRAIPCTDGKIRVWGSASSVPTEIYSVLRTPAGYTFKRI